MIWLWVFFSSVPIIRVSLACSSLPLSPWPQLSGTLAKTHYRITNKSSWYVFLCFSAAIKGRRARVCRWCVFNEARKKGLPDQHTPSSHLDEAKREREKERESKKSIHRIRQLENKSPWKRSKIISKLFILGTARAFPFWSRIHVYSRLGKREEWRVKGG